MKYNFDLVKQIKQETVETSLLLKTRQKLFDLDFPTINRNIELLCQLIDKNILEYNKKVIEDKPLYWIKCKKPKRWFRNPYMYILIDCKGTYFNSREAITFCDSGYIGFCGEADSENEIPILTAFAEWLNIINAD